MSTATLSRKPAEEAPRTTAATGVIRVDADLAKKIAMIAQGRDLDIADVVSPLIRATIEKEYNAFLDELIRSRRK